MSEKIKPTHLERTAFVYVPPLDTRYRHRIARKPSYIDDGRTEGALITHLGLPSMILIFPMLSFRFGNSFGKEAPS